MSTVRLARSDEIPAKLTRGNDEAAAYLDTLLDKGCTRPEWCFVAEDDGEVSGSVVLWSMPDAEVPSDFVLWDAPWDSDGLATGRALLDAAAKAAAEAGASRQGHVLDSPTQPPQFQDHAKEREELLRASGFDVARDGLRYRWRAGDAVVSPDAGLTWKSLEELGHDPFVDLLENILDDTRDSLLQADVKEHGLRCAAEIFWAECLEFEHRPQWFEIGFDGDEPAAISLAGRNPTVAVVCFVGVSPKHRGKGYATAAASRCTEVLVGADAEEIRGDCDASNVAMAKGFERAGYENFARRLEFVREL
ncbi:MAG TPA: GNAT family N-acetyltransferase [Stackebrandtia sp.]|jgi:RimJ/RimL family protein N-acetyltransferase|uniref:GNAT family N-acetyltransferase n=1 Tax=Stackebrandtia sp. TaxID=2023065 RepID=UPI002D72C68A|nr:GNAT family N-acetyltransferase [Stackebrandtia sp.]HZE40049.1 GNAT family N-acetyltransferase [Stackebrandtia sp.]